jgi:hypothetical protein
MHFISQLLTKLSKRLRTTKANQPKSLLQPSLPPLRVHRLRLQHPQAVVAQPPVSSALTARTRHYPKMATKTNRPSRRSAAITSLLPVRPETRVSQSAETGFKGGRMPERRFRCARPNSRVGCTLLVIQATSSRLGVIRTRQIPRQNALGALNF